MSCVLYYSNFCNHSKNILGKLSKSNIKSNIHFLCIDKRITKESKNYIILENGDHILLPSIITKVPCLMLLHKKNDLLFGDDIHKHFDLIIRNSEFKSNPNTDTRSIKNEPESFSMSSIMGSIKSDNFSFLDTSVEDLGAKGKGGLRMMYNYSALTESEKIETPPEDYTPNKVNETDLKKYQEERERGVTAT